MLSPQALAHRTALPVSPAEIDRTRLMIAARDLRRVLLPPRSGAD